MMIQRRVNGMNKDVQLVSQGACDRVDGVPSECIAIEVENNVVIRLVRGRLLREQADTAHFAYKRVERSGGAFTHGILFVQVPKPIEQNGGLKFRETEILPL